MASPRVSGVSGRCPSAARACSKSVAAWRNAARSAGPGSGLPPVGHGLVPHRAPEGVQGQGLDLIGQALGSETFEGRHDAGMEHAPPLLEHTAIGDLVRQGMLEGVLVLREESRLVEELGRLEVRESAMQCRLGHLGNRLQQGQRDLRTNDGGGLEEALRLGGQAVNACCQHRLHRGWHLDGGQRLFQTIGARRADQHARFDQGPHALLQEERVPLGALNQQPFQGLQAPHAAPLRRRRAGRREQPRHFLAAAGRAAVACSRSCCPSRAHTPGGS